MEEHLILVDGPLHGQLKPLSLTRSVAELRVGILTIQEKWKRHLQLAANPSILSPIYGNTALGKSATSVLLVNAGLLPNKGLAEALRLLEADSSLFSKGSWLASKVASAESIQTISNEFPKTLGAIVEYDATVDIIERPWHLFQKNAAQIKSDFALITSGQQSMAVPEHCFRQNEEDIFIEEGAELTNCSLNAKNGPIYIGQNAKVMEGALIQGPFALLEGAQVKMGAKISDGTSIGPYCKVGGEVGNSILLGYSNKGHDGYLGNSVLGEWCNLGADTNTSNLKNNYSPVKAWSYTESQMVNTETQFCGLVMGDHSKSGINTMFNTGTVVGVCCSIFGGDFPAKHIPSFSWGGANGFETYDFDKAISTARIVMKRRNKELSKEQETTLANIFEERKGN